MALQTVVERGPRPDGVGWRDRLACGHVVAFDGKRVQHRQCPECPEGVTADQSTLFD